MERLWEVEASRGSDRMHAATLASLGGAAQSWRSTWSARLPPSTRRHVTWRRGVPTSSPRRDQDRARASTTRALRRVDEARLRPVLDDLARAGHLRRASSTSRAARNGTRSSTTCSRPRACLARPARGGAGAGAGAGGARRRHRRLAILVVALGALAVTAALAVWALSQRADAREQALAADAGARAAKARELEASSAVQLGRDPELGLLLARHAARLAPAAGTADVLRRALRESRVRTVARLGASISDLDALPDGTLAAVTERGGVRLVDGGTPGRVVVPPRRGAQTWLSGGQALTLRGTTLTVRDLPEGDLIATVPVPPGHAFRRRRAARTQNSSSRAGAARR